MRRPTLDPTTYRGIRINGVLYPANRVAFVKGQSEESAPAPVDDALLVCMHRIDHFVVYTGHCIEVMAPFTLAELVFAV